MMCLVATLTTKNSRSLRLRLVGLLLLAACESPRQATPGPVLAPALYPAGAAALWPRLNLPQRAVLGRGAAPRVVASLPIEAAAPLQTPMLLPSVTQVPGARALAAVAGAVDGVPAVELIDVDAGRVLWRDTTTCTAPIVAVRSDAIVCADGHGVRAIDLTGRQRWRVAHEFVAQTGGHVIVADGAQANVLAADTGALERQLQLPQPLTPGMVRGVCHHDKGWDIAIADGASLVRYTLANNPSAPLLRTWQAPFASVALEIADDGGQCRDEWMVQSLGVAGVTLTSLSRTSGAVLARLDDITGIVRRSDDTLLVSTRFRVTHVNRRLANLPAAAHGVPPFGRALATFGDAALVQMSAHTAMLIDVNLHTAWFELSGQSAALGSQRVIAGNRNGNLAASLHAYGLPATSEVTASITRHAAPLYVPAELRDLPPSVPLPVAQAVAAAGEASHWVGAALVDPLHHELVYVVTMADAPSAQNRAGISLLDVKAKQWRWHAREACGVGTPVAIAKTDSTIVCASQAYGALAASVVASDANGLLRWQWHGAAIDAVSAQGDAVLVHRGHIVTVLDGDTGAQRGELTLLPSTLARAALVADGRGGAWLVSAAGATIVVRSTKVGLVPLWTAAVHGVVASVQAFGAAALITLEDGDVYLLDLDTAAVSAVPTVADRVVALGDLLASESAQPDGTWQQALWRADLSPVTRNDYALNIAVARPASAHPAVPVVPVVPGRKPPARRLPAAPAVPPPPRVMHYPASASYVRSGGAAEVLLLFSATHAAAVDAATGTPRALVTLPADATGVGFATEVDGVPRTGILLRAPLRAVLF